MELCTDADEASAVPGPCVTLNLNQFINLLWGLDFVHLESNRTHGAELSPSTWDRALPEHISIQD